MRLIQGKVVVLGKGHLGRNRGIGGQNGILGKVGMRKVPLGKVWTRMELLEKIGVGKGHLRRKKNFGANWALWVNWVSERDY